jgi:chromosome segregation ATPase
MMLEFSGASEAASAPVGASPSTISDWPARYRTLNQEYEREREARQSFEAKWARERAAFIGAQARNKELQAEIDDLLSQLNRTKAKLAASEGNSMSIAQSVTSRQPIGGSLSGEAQTALSRDLQARDRECAALRRQLDDLTSVLDEQRDYYEGEIRKLAAAQGGAAIATGTDASVQVSALQKQLEALMAHSVAADETIASMDMDNTQLRSQVSNLTKQLQDQQAIVGEKEELVRQAAILKQQLDALMAHSEAADATISAMDLENAQLHTQVADLNRKLMAAQAGLPIKSDGSDVVILKQQIEALLAHSKAADETVAALSSDNDQLRAQTSELSKQLARQQSEGAGEASTLTTLQQQVEALTTYSGSMDQTIAALTLENTQLRSELSDRERHTNSSADEQEVAALKQQIDALLQHSSSSDQSIAAMDMENARLRSQVADLTKQLQTAKPASNVISLLKENESMKRQIEALLAHSETSDTTVAAMDMEISQLRSENAALKNQGSALSAKNSVEMQDLRSQVEALMSHIGGLDHTIAAMDIEKQQLRSQLTDSAKQTEAQRAVFNQKEKELAHLQTVVVEMTNQLEAVKAHCQSIDKNSSMLEADNARLRNDIATLKSENHNLKAVSAVENTPSFGPSKMHQLEQLTQRAASHEKVVGDLKQRLKQYADKCDSLEQDKSDLADRSAILESQIKAMAAELDEAHSRIRSLQEKLSGFNTPTFPSADSNPFDVFDVKASTESFPAPLSPIASNTAVRNPFEVFDDVPSTPAPPIPTSPSVVATPSRSHVSVAYSPDDVKQEVEMLRSNLSRSQAANKLLQQQLDKLNKRAAEQVRELSEANAALVEQVETHVREASEISEKVRLAYVTELEVARSKAIAAESAVVALERRLDAASRRNTELMTELNELTTTLAASANDSSFEITELRNSLFEVEVGNKHLETESRSLETQNADLMREVASLRSQISILMNKGECEEHDIIALHQQIDALNAELSSQKNIYLFEISKASEENTSMRKQLAELRESLDQKNRDVASAQAKFASELETSAKTCEGLRDALSASASREQVLATALENARASLAASASGATAESGRLRASLAEVEANHAAAQKELASLQTALSESAKRRDGLEVSLRDVTVERDALRQKFEQLQSNQPQHQPQDFSSHIHGGIDGHSAFDHMVPSIDDWGHAADDGHAAFGAPTSTHADGSTAEIEMLRATLQDTNAELKRLQDKYADAFAQNQQLRSELVNNKANAEEARTADNNDLVEELIKYKMANVTMASELDEQRMRASNLERSNRRLSERIAELESVMGGSDKSSSSWPRGPPPPLPSKPPGQGAPNKAAQPPPKGPAPKR